MVDLTKLNRIFELHLDERIPAYYKPMNTASFKQAAVLVPILVYSQIPNILLTKRAEDLSLHSGQVAFPGGRLELGESTHEAALREANEEIGLSASLVNIIGTLGMWPTVSEYLVTPVIGIIETKPTNWILNQNEVHAVFEVPLSYLLDLKHYQTRHRMHQGQQIAYFTLSYGEYEIWGFTAAILHYMATLYSEV